MKTNWIKRGLTLLCCGMLMAGMTGCGDKGGSSSSTPGSKTESNYCHAVADGGKPHHHVR